MNQQNSFRFPSDDKIICHRQLTWDEQALTWTQQYSTEFKDLGSSFELLVSLGSLTNAEWRGVVPAPDGPGHTGDVGVALWESGTKMSQANLGHNPTVGWKLAACLGLCVDQEMQRYPNALPKGGGKAEREGWGRQWLLTITKEFSLLKVFL